MLPTRLCDVTADVMCLTAITRVRIDACTRINTIAVTTTYTKMRIEILLCSVIFYRS